MLSKFCNPLFQQHKVALIAQSSVRYFVQTTARNARTGGFRSNYSEQFAFRSRTVAQPTLRERLLGPTSGKPFIYGTYALAGASVFGIGSLCYYGLVSKDISIIDRSAMWPEYVRHRVHLTYGYLASGLGLTAASAIVASRSPFVMSLVGRGTIPALFITIGAIIATSVLAHSIPYENLVPKHMAWGLHSAVMGAVLAPMCVLGGPALFRAAWYTAGVVGGLSAVAMCAPSDKFLYMGAPLAMGLGVVFVSSMGTFFFPPHTALGAGLASIAVYGGLVLFSAMLLYNTQRAVKMAETMPYNRLENSFGRETPANIYPAFDPINAQMGMYADILNIFIRIAMITGGTNRRK